MAVSNLQTWADNLEYIRIPAIKSDIADLTSAQAVYASELSAKAQEFTDRLDAHNARIMAAQTDATSASVAASAVSTEVYGAKLDAITYTNQKYQQALDAIEASNTDIRNYLDSDFAAYLQTLIDNSDAFLSNEVAAALLEAINARDALNQEIDDLNLINNQLLDQEVPAINQSLQDSLIRLVGLEYFNEEMFGGMEFPDIQALHDKLAGEVQDATAIATAAANDPEVRKLINQVKIDSAIMAAQNVSNSSQDVVAFEEVGNAAAAIVTEQKARADGDSANASSVTALESKIDNDFAAAYNVIATKVDPAGALSAIEDEVRAQFGSLSAMASVTQSAKATADGIQSGFVWRLNNENVMELFSVSDGSGGNTVTQKLGADYVEITGLAQINQAVITDLVADSAFIEDLYVETFNIAGNAVTVPDSVTGSQKTGDGGWKELVRKTINIPGGSSVLILWTIEQGYSDLVNPPKWGYRIKRGSNIIDNRSDMSAINDYPTGQYMIVAHSSTIITPIILEWNGGDSTITGVGTLTLITVKR